jgi:hypothetical protein
MKNEVDHINFGFSTKLMMIHLNMCHAVYAHLTANHYKSLHSPILCHLTIAYRQLSINSH